MNAPLSVTVTQLNRLRQEPAPPVIVDVREEWERDIVALDGAIAIPLQSLPQRASELPKDRPIMVMCHHGGRSATATTWLRQNGFIATNVEGGIDSWAEQIDSALARY